MTEDEVTAPNAEKPLGVLLLELRDESMAFARAQANLVRVEVGEKARGLAIYAAIAALGVTLAFGALIALLVGLIQLAAIHIGIGWAIVLVIGVALLLATILALVARAGIRRLFSKRATR